MASRCVQVCVRCRAALCSAAGTSSTWRSSTWRTSTQVRRCVAGTRTASTLRGDQTAVQPRLRWKHPACYCSGLTARWLTAGAKDGTAGHQLARSEVAARLDPTEPAHLDLDPTEPAHLDLDPTEPAHLDLDPTEPAHLDLDPRELVHLDPREPPVHLDLDPRELAHLDLDPREPSPVTESIIPLADLDAAASSALEEISDAEAVSICVPPVFPPASSSLRDYVDQSETLTRLVQLGVNLWKLEQRPNVGSMLLRLDFRTDVAPRLLFLRDIGVDESCFGSIISHNPFILTESLENLQTRVNYLKSRKFSSEAVASMVSRAPYLLNFSVKRLDNRLGFYQQQLKLSPTNTRDVVARLPRLLCGSLEPVKENLKVCEIEFGFKQTEIQHIIMTVPKVLTANKKKLTQIFDFLHNTMKVPHHLITRFPQVLNSKYLRLRERHLFLQYLHRAQYDPALANYVSLDRLVSLPDDAFCTEVASASLDDFHLFQKTL